jgi:organic radical activating enzyme
LDSIATQLHTAKIPYVCISGGEPLLSAAFPNIIKTLKSNSDCKITVLTSGCVPISQFILEPLFEASVVQISLDSIYPEENCEVRTNSEKYAPLDFIRTMLSLGHTGVRIACTVSSVNIDHIPDLITAMDELTKIDSIVLQPVLPLGRAHDNDYLYVSSEKLNCLKSQLQLQDASIKSNMKIVIVEDAFIQLRENKQRGFDLAELHITPEGIVWPHALVPCSIGNILTKDIQAIFLENSHFWSIPNPIVDGIVNLTSDIYQENVGVDMEVTNFVRRVVLNPICIIDRTTNSIIIEDNHFYLNDTGFEIIDLCNEPIEVSTIVDMVSSIYKETSADIIMNDIHEMLNFCVSHDVLHVLNS